MDTKRQNPRRSQRPLEQDLDAQVPMEDDASSEFNGGATSQGPPKPNFQESVKLNGSKLDTKARVVIFALVVAVIAFVFVAYNAIIMVGEAANAVKVITVYDTFVDINGDGLTDLIKEADVVINTGTLNMTDADADFMNQLFQK